jgi:DNA-binding LytR/AlgR family response regulator
LLKETAFGNFIRIHRSFAVQKHFIEKVRPGEVLVRDVVLPVGRNYKDSLNFLKP